MMQGPALRCLNVPPLLQFVNTQRKHNRYVYSRTQIDWTSIFASVAIHRTNHTAIFFTWLSDCVHLPRVQLVTMLWICMVDKILIEAICSFPCLWQVSSKGYKDARAREKAWKKVAMRLSMIAYWFYHSTSPKYLREEVRILIEWI